MNVLLLDNYDSFTYNLRHLLEEIGDVTVDVVYNNAIAVDDVSRYDKILLSPGPGLPSEAGHMLSVIRQFAESKPILGICLGMQAIAEAFGGALHHLDHVYHGVASRLQLTKPQSCLYKGIEEPISVGRYHSWAVREELLPPELRVTATTNDGTPMSLEHVSLPIFGVQYHPESVLTPAGRQIVANFLAV